MKKIWIGILVVFVVVKLASCPAESNQDAYDSDLYRGGDFELTEQDIDNIEFYYEMKEKWDNYEQK